MDGTTGSGDAGFPTRNSIACEPCRHKKRKCDRDLPCCRQCSRDPSKCYYPEQYKRGLPPGFTARLEARLAETEGALFHVLSLARTHEALAGIGNILVTASHAGIGNRSKADRVKEWESLPLRSSGEIEAWFRWRSGAGQGPQGSTQEGSEHLQSHDSGVRHSCQSQYVPSYSGIQPSPGHDPAVGSPAASRTSASGAKELSESQRNMYF